MPLTGDVPHDIKAEKRAGKPQEQAVAIALKTHRDKVGHDMAVQIEYKGQTIDKRAEGHYYVGRKSFRSEAMAKEYIDSGARGDGINLRDQEIIDHIVVALEKGMSIDKLENLFASRYKIAGEDFIRLLQVATRIARHDNMGALPICMPKEEMEGILRAYLEGREFKYRADAKAKKDRSSKEHAAEADRLEALAAKEKDTDVKKRIEERAEFHREEVGMDSKRGDVFLGGMKAWVEHAKHMRSQGKSDEEIRKVLKDKYDVTADRIERILSQTRGDMAACKVGDRVIVGGSWDDTPGTVEECSGNRVKVKPDKGPAEWVPIINCKKRADDDCDEVAPSRADSAIIQQMMYGDKMRQHALDKMIDGMAELKSRADKIFQRDDAEYKVGQQVQIKNYGRSKNKRPWLTARIAGPLRNGTYMVDIDPPNQVPDMDDARDFYSPDQIKG